MKRARCCYVQITTARVRRYEPIIIRGYRVPECEVSDLGHGERVWRARRTRRLITEGCKPSTLRPKMPFITVDISSLMPFGITEGVLHWLRFGVVKGTEIFWPEAGCSTVYLKGMSRINFIWLFGVGGIVSPLDGIWVSDDTRDTIIVELVHLVYHWHLTRRRVLG